MNIYLISALICFFIFLLDKRFRGVFTWKEILIPSVVPIINTITVLALLFCYLRILILGPKYVFKKIGSIKTHPIRAWSEKKAWEKLEKKEKLFLKENWKL